jgi:hypothetical protein
MTLPSSVYTEIVSTTLNRYSSKLYDNILNHNPLLARLKRKEQATTIPGGVKILENLEYGENGTVKWYSGLETLDVSSSDVFTSAEFEWKELNANVVITGKEKAQNSGSKESVHSLVKSKIRNAEKSLKNELAAALFYSNTENSGKSVGGLQHLVADDPTSGTVGGIDASSQTWWRNQFYDFSAESVTAGSDTILAAMNEVYINTMRNADKVDFIVSGKTYFQYYLESLQANQRFTADNEASAGFSSLKFWGGAADVFFDGNAGDTRMYFLNTDYVYMRPHRDFNFVTMDEARSINQDATVVPMFWKGNMTISNRSLQGVVVA